MNRKHNPWAALVGLLLGLLLVILCAGCGVMDDVHPGARFTIEQYDMDGSVYGVCIITDTETDVQYLAYKTPAGIGMTALQGGEG